MKMNLLLIIGVFLATACQNKEHAQVEKLEREVMMVLDVVMPKMGELVALESDVSSKITQTDSLPQITLGDSSLKRTLQGKMPSLSRYL